ncbi:putative efflux system component YknX [Clostridium homopropionicum DSM 5847]|uniref:Putative efflux system component YknX n=1 Tax=Clostridium homopropionicum DSM 5847 TaxID=1121318 RepID=A0A0L6Z788_9CLOT|nr:HlyD family efflux transporter periplasmic adaptor subunit [Clostridium homopropionicum]KOA18827.1 putative efflux system component YknX [Clostridium homopropionicum DSM 5847]SFG89718.1 HlyD family secretion protein [Clostridium homopropionicum]
MKKKTVIYILILIVIVSGVFWMRNNRKNKEIITVKTAAAGVGEIKSYLSTSGIVKSKNYKEYYGTQGKIKTLNVKVGDKVNKGDTLLTYETQDLSLTVKQAEIQYENAVLQRNDLYNQNKTVKDKIAELDKEIAQLEKSSNQLDKTKLEALKQQRNSLSPISQEKLKQMDNAVNLAKISLDTARKNLQENKATIVAENAGVVTAVNGVVGAVSNGMQPVIVVQDTENLKVQVSLGKYDAKKVKLGQEVNIVDENSRYKGKVSLIDPAATKTQSMSGNETTLGAEIDVLDKAEELKIDFDVDVEILTGQVANVLKVPIESIKAEKGNKNLIYVLQGDIVKEKQVKTGIQSDTEIEIKEGINKGDKVILNPSASIIDGIVVKEFKEGENASGK